MIAPFTHSNPLIFLHSGKLRGFERLLARAFLFEGAQ